MSKLLNVLEEYIEKNLIANVDDTLYLLNILPLDGCLIWYDEDIKTKLLSEFGEESDSIKDIISKFIEKFYRDNNNDNFLKLFEHYGGEGQGDIYYDVYHHIPSDTYIKLEGYYSSYNGVEYYDGWSKVKPVEKVAYDYVHVD